MYGGGGNSGAPYKQDFIELFNRGTTAVNISGWSVQYAGNTGITWQKTDLPAATIQPGQYFLVQQAEGGGTTQPNLPAPDATGNIPMNASAGKVALVNNTTTLSGACPLGPSVIDFVGYGTASTNACFEGSGPAPNLSNSTAAIRKSDGCAETDNNAADFAAGAPTPRNTSSPTHACAAAAQADVEADGQAGTLSITRGAFPLEAWGLLPRVSREVDERLFVGSRALFGQTLWATANAPPRAAEECAARHTNKGPPRWFAHARRAGCS